MGGITITSSTGQINIPSNETDINVVEVVIQTEEIKIEIYPEITTVVIDEIDGGTWD